MVVIIIVIFYEKAAVNKQKLDQDSSSHYRDTESKSNEVIKLNIKCCRIRKHLWKCNTGPLRNYKLMSTSLTTAEKKRDVTDG